jgi:transglutaminase-like putative cysteine protease
LQGLAELSLFVLTVAIVFGFSRVFTTWSFFVPLMAVAAAIHLATLLARRAGLGVVISAAITVAALALVTSWVFFWDATTVGVPTGATLDAARAAFDESWNTFNTVTAPAPTQTGFLVASAIGVAFAVFLADWAAFRLWSTAEAAVPALTLFIFCALLGADQHRVSSSALFLLAALGFWLIHRSARRESDAWLTGSGDGGSRSVLRVGALLVASAVLVGLVVGQRLPGATSDALLSWRDGQQGTSSRVTISPMVNLKERLVNQSQVEVFTVQSNERSYWRLTALDTFDGTIWKSGGSYGEASGDLPHDDLPPGTGQVEANQDFTISGLSALWVPAAFEPRRIDGASGVRYQRESSTLIVDTERPDSSGLNYRVTSVLPRFTAEQLQTATAPPPPDLAPYLALPIDFSLRASQTASQVTRNATTPYDKARELQDWFAINGGFTYSLDVPSGHGESAIDVFLTEKQGYCEQFAGTFAAMARSLGIPSRVAVGFTPGETDPSDPTAFVVRGENAHAWPEVWLSDYGWVPFEPTPSRGAPGAEAWTGRPEAQALPGDPQSTSTTSSTSTTVANTPSTTAPTAGPDASLPDLATGAPTTGTGTAESPTSVWVRLAQLGALALLAMVLLGATTMAIGSSRRARRRARAVDPSGHVRVAWAETEEHLALLGWVRRPAETYDEFAQRVGPDLGDDAAVSLRRLSADVDAAAYAPDLLDDTRRTIAEADARCVHAVVAARVPRWRQWVDAADPRRLRPTAPTTKDRPSRATVSAGG